MKKQKCIKQALSLLLVLCLLPAKGFAGSGGAADSNVLAYQTGLSLLKTSSLTDQGKLQDIRNYFEQAGVYFSVDYLMFADSLLILLGNDTFAYDDALSKIKRISRYDDFMADYNAITDNSGRMKLPDMESLKKYTHARKLEAF